jgi:hypothetical protein
MLLCPPVYRKISRKGQIADDVMKLSALEKRILPLAPDCRVSIPVPFAVTLRAVSAVVTLRVFASSLRSSTLTWVNVPTPPEVILAFPPISSVASLDRYYIRSCIAEGYPSCTASQSNKS